MFQRLDITYSIDYSKLDLDAFMQDEANPLVRIARLIPDGSKVLDIGAGNGLLGWLISRIHQKTVIDGVEPCPGGAGLAEKYYRKFYCSTIEGVREQLSQVYYDFIVLADVIEHISDPLSFLRNIAETFHSKSKIILNIPNVAHGGVRLELLNGYFEYVDSGILEKTHLRFFTWDTIIQMVNNLNYYPVVVYHLQRDFMKTKFLQARNKPGFFSLYRLMNDRHSLTYQYLLVLSKDKIPSETGIFGYRGISLAGYFIRRTKIVLKASYKMLRKILLSN